MWSRLRGAAQCSAGEAGIGALSRQNASHPTVSYTHSAYGQSRSPHRGSMSAEKRPVADTAAATQPGTSSNTAAASTTATQAKPATTATHNIVFVPPKLSEILDLTKISAESPKNIIEIWKLFHEGKFAICAAISTAQYAKLGERATQFPRFLCPGTQHNIMHTVATNATCVSLLHVLVSVDQSVLRDETGTIEMFTTEWHDDNLLVTSLIEYKLRGARASPALIMRHYRELESSKQLVLMRGQIDPSRLSVAEAGLIANQFQLQYLSDSFFKLVRVFNETPAQFDVNALLAVYLGKGSLRTAPTTPQT